MFPHLATDDLHAQLDATVAEALSLAGIDGPPVDAFALARRLGLMIAWDDLQQGRARLVRSRHGGWNGVAATILLKPDERPERHHWAIAHEIGEHLAHRVYEGLYVDPREVDPRRREDVANRLAGRLLLPAEWFDDDARRLDWELPELKSRYTTASHELIARRMLELDEPQIVTVFDHGRVTWRIGNLEHRCPKMSDVESRCWRDVHKHGAAVSDTEGPLAVRCWAVHEPDWKREILRTAIDEFGCDG